MNFVGLHSAHSKWLHLIVTLILLFSFLSTVLSSIWEVRIFNVLKILFDHSMLLGFLNEFWSSVIVLISGWPISSYFLVLFIGLVLNKTVNKNRKRKMFEGENVGLVLIQERHHQIFIEYLPHEPVQIILRSRNDFFSPACL